MINEISAVSITYQQQWSWNFSFQEWRGVTAESNLERILNQWMGIVKELFFKFKS